MPRIDPRLIILAGVLAGCKSAQTAGSGGGDPARAQAISPLSNDPRTVDLAVAAATMVTGPLPGPFEVQVFVRDAGFGELGPLVAQRLNSGNTYGGESVAAWMGREQPRNARSFLQIQQLITTAQFDSAWAFVSVRSSVDCGTAGQACASGTTRGPVKYVANCLFLTKPGTAWSVSRRRELRLPIDESAFRRRC